MKQSRRSKEVIKPAVSPIIDPKKPITNYQQYEEQLAQFQQNNKHNNIANLFDWTKPSEIISVKPQQKKSQQDKKEQEVIRNNSMNTEELLRSQRDPKERQHSDQYLDDSFEVQVPKAQPSYAQRMKNEYGNEYRDMSNSQIESELKAMREKILEMNEKLNKLLDKYELMGVKHVKKQAQINNPYKFLCKEIQINNKVIANQLEQIKQIQDKDKQLQKKDYLVELNELIIQISKQIHDIGKEKHSRWVDVERIDRLLKQIEDIQGTQEQYRQVKQLKVKIVYYFKKLKSQKAQQEQYDTQIEKISQKNDQMSRQYESYMQLAIKKSLEVSTNKKYLQLKKKHDELVLAVQNAKRNKQITIKFQLVAEQKLQREKQSMKKQIQKISLQILQIQHKSIALDQQTNSIVVNNRIPNESIKSISYRFDTSLIHTEKPNFKPDFKRAISKMQTGRESANKTISNSTENEQRNKLINDKNMTIDESSSKDQQSDLTSSKLKPILRQWKGKSEQSRYAQSPLSSKFKTLQVSNIFKPPLLIKAKKNNR